MMMTITTTTMTTRTIPPAAPPAMPATLSASTCRSFMLSVILSFMLSLDVGVVDDGGAVPVLVVVTDGDLPGKQMKFSESRKLGC